jgi:hypothetical protein
MSSLENPEVVSPEAPQRLERRRHSKSRQPRWLRRLRRRVKLGMFLLVLVALLLVIAVSAVALAVDSNNRVQSSIESISRIINSLTTKDRTELTLNDFTRLEAGVNDLVLNLDISRQRLGLLRPVQLVNNQLEPALIQINAAHELALAARDMLNGLRPTLFFLVAGDDEEQVLAQISSGERVVELLQIGRSQFLRAEQRLASARDEIDKLNLGTLPPDLVLTADGLEAYFHQLTDMNRILLQAPAMLTAALGLDEERSYLILSQNSDELRPSGGYISTFGWLKVRNGRVIDYNYSPTTRTSPNPPPAHVEVNIELPDWWIRYNQPAFAAWDGSWYVDFPSTAEMSMWYYNAGNNPQSPVDGVFAIDIAGFEAILESLGSVVVPGFDQAVNAENFRDLVYGIRSTGEGIEHKTYIAALYQQIFDDWQTASRDPKTSTQILGKLLEALQQKHIMLYFVDDNLNSALQSLGWAGRQDPARDHDYLLVADTNLGNKSNRSILRRLTYDVEIQPDGSLSNRATVSYDYSARIAANDPAVGPAHGLLDYRNLMQVFVPVGSTLTNTNNLSRQPDIVETADHTTFVSRVQVDYDTSQRFQFIYETPPLVETIGPYQRYRLQVQKQPGTLAHAADIQVALPPGATIIGVTPEPATDYDLDRPILEFRLVMEFDQWIEVIYQVP